MRSPNFEATMSADTGLEAANLKGEQVWLAIIRRVDEIKSGGTCRLR